MTYSGDPERGTERGIVMLGPPGSRRRDRLPKGWLRLLANGVTLLGQVRQDRTQRCQGEGHRL